MDERHWLPIVAVAILGLAVGCGGGGGGDEDDFPGEFWTAIDIHTDPCGPTVREVMGSDLTELSGGKIRIDIYLSGADGCGPETWTLYGTQTGPASADIEDEHDVFLCALESEYGYGAFDITNAEMTEINVDVWRIEGDFLGEYGGADCAGTIFITLDDS